MEPKEKLAKPKASDNSSPPPPPWKYKKGLDYKELTSDSKPKQSSFSTKWLLVTILLVLVTNTATAFFFINRNKTSNPKTALLSNYPNATDSATNSNAADNKTVGSFKNGLSQITNGKYSSAMSEARDASRKADLASIGTAVNMYYVESDLPTDFPSEKTCIGKSAGCYDLEELLVPDYLKEVPKDPTIGAEINTGYLIYYDDSEGFVLEASGENTPVITTYR